jgi:hypothetical protein
MVFNNVIVWCSYNIIAFRMANVESTGCTIIHERPTKLHIPIFISVVQYHGMDAYMRLVITHRTYLIHVLA